MLIFRFVIIGLLVGSALSFALYIGTQDRRWMSRGLLILKWTVIAGLAFFAVLLLERIAIAV
ncbi:hypothetical protein [Sphaerotilus microaerophilus]|jgi:hypothetical protein|uniref:Twin transmembrane helix small protein n=1 Tax=Sphaerotilus microaerophilus TaxID=2914710 RepID=A0ABN6PGX9_9BURK|nr:hypothetical protein [Sphaerotilus sp. FB-5]BDI04236.1 hypothetical protein CATMQ487_12060 [Sphaerotilus sp. FB-5]